MSREQDTWIPFHFCIMDDWDANRISDSAFRVWLYMLCLIAEGGGSCAGDVDALSFRFRRSRDETQSALKECLDAGLLALDSNEEYMSGPNCVINV